MAKQFRAIVLTDEAVSKVKDLKRAEMPSFVFVPEMGRKSIDEIESDLVLVPVLAGMKVPRDLHARNEGVGDLIKEAIREQGFQGKRGQRLLVETDLPGFDSQSQRHVLLAGLGRPDRFCGGTAYEVFHKLIEEAISLGVSRITIPFAPNRGTSACLNMKGMGHKLHLALHNCVSKIDHPIKLKELQIYCTPQARPHIQKGLDIPVGEAHKCCTKI